MMFQSVTGELTLLRCLALLGSVGLSSTIATIIYRLFFHPLANFPGPFWARITGFPAYYHTVKQDRHIWFYQLQERYGPDFRIAPDSVLLNTPAGYKTIFNNKANVQKAEYYKAYPRKVEAVTTWNVVNKQTHARKRRVLMNAFSDKAMRSAEPFIHQNIDRWCELLGQEAKGDDWSSSVNMADWANHLIFDILGDLCFGKSFGMKEPGSELRYAPGLMTSFLSILHPIAFSPFTSLWVWLKPRGLNKMLADNAPPALKDWETFVTKCFTERAQMEEDLKANPKPEEEVRKDFFHYLFGAVDPETGKLGYSLDELFGESEMLIIAGSDTTAISTAATFFYLSHNPDVQEKLAEEIAAAFPGVEDIKGGLTLSGCKYLQAFIHEVLRMSPPVPADMSREVSEGGLVVGDKFLPAGVKVSTASYCMHMNKEFYPEPYKFRPERWIVDETDETGASAASVALAESAYMPFSGGPRGCAGKNLAYLEMGLVIAKVLSQFEIRREPDTNVGGGSPDLIEGRREPGQYQLHDIFVGIRDGPMVQVRKRTPAGAGIAVSRGRLS